MEVKTKVKEKEEEKKKHRFSDVIIKLCDEFRLGVQLLSSSL